MITSACHVLKFPKIVHPSRVLPISLAIKGILQTKHALVHFQRENPGKIPNTFNTWFFPASSPPPDVQKQTVDPHCVATHKFASRSPAALSPRSVFFFDQPDFAYASCMLAKGRTVHTVGIPAHSWAYSVQFRPNRPSFGRPEESSILAKCRMTAGLLDPYVLQLAKVGDLRRPLQNPAWIAD